MYRKLEKFYKYRAVKIIIEVLFILLVYFAIKTFTQRHLVEGAAPSLQGVSISGQNLSLQALKGQVVLVHFWATWCSICKLEQDSIAGISKHHAIITVAMNSGTPANVESYLHKNKLSFPVIVDDEGTIAKRFGVRGVPTSFVIDRNGKIRFSEVGYTTGWGLNIRLWLAKIW